MGSHGQRRGFLVSVHWPKTVADGQLELARLLQPNFCNFCSTRTCRPTPVLPRPALAPPPCATAHAALPSFVCWPATTLPGRWLRHPSCGGPGPDEYGAHAHHRGVLHHSNELTLPRAHVALTLPLERTNTPRRRSRKTSSTTSSRTRTRTRSSPTWWASCSSSATTSPTLATGRASPSCAR